VRYLSVCSGIEGASVAWEPLGWTPVAFAEIERFPSAVLAHRFPHTPNLGDFTKIGKDDVGAIDVLVGGTPCQDFSVAGLRAGLAGDRGALTIEFLHLARRLRPEWLVWENVPGVLSADAGRAFGTFVGILGKLGYGFAYRVLDAQYCGVPQRRRRVFVVGCFGGDWRRAAQVLFERHSLSGDLAPSRQARKVTPSLTSSGAGVSRVKGAARSDDVEWVQTVFDASCAQVAPTLPSRSSAGGGLGTDFDCDGGLICAQVAPTLVRDGAGVERTGNERTEADFLIAHTNADRASGGAPVITRGNSFASAPKRDSAPLLRELFDAVGAQAFAEWRLRVSDSFQSSEVLQSVMYGDSLRCEADKDRTRLDDGALPRTEDLPAGAVRDLWLIASRGASPGRKLAEQLAREFSASMPIVSHERASSAVRRLLPVEVERLQGFPDDWTLVPYRGKPASDGPRYRSLGNSFAVPVIRWIGERIGKASRAT